jgi:hypothetical protein
VRAVRIRLGWIIAAVLGGTLGVAAQSCETPEATAVCENGYVLSTGVLSAAEHEANEGYFTIGKPLGDSIAPLTQFFLNPGNPSIHHVRPRLGQVVSLCIVPAPPRPENRIIR